MAAPVALHVVRLVVAGVFLYAGALKIADAPGLAREIQHYRLIPWPEVTVLLAIYLPWVEMLAGAAVLFRRLYLGGLVAIAGLMLLFTAALGSAWARGLEISCGCFGREERPAGARTNYPALLGRDLAILAGAVLLLGAEWRARRFDGGGNPVK